MPQDDLVVICHYVRPSHSDGVTGLTPGKFSRQPDLIGKRCCFVADARR